MIRSLSAYTTLTTATILLYLVALFLTVATLWPFSYPTQIISLKETAPRFFWVLIIVIIPVMLIYFGLAFAISDTISMGATLPPEEELSLSESLVVAVSYVGLSVWLWLRWRNPIAPSLGILGPVIIATACVLIIVGVIWAAHHDHKF